MRYLFLIGSSPDMTESSAADDGPTIEEWVGEVYGGGAGKIGDRLRPASEATTVRVRGGETLVTDGPFVEGSDYIGGFDVIECADLDEAIAIARKHPMARHGLIEIRPSWPLDL
ncbi:hypothetical protein CLV46_1149 [Diaminobutyricimonas aerilata]|uniref:YCII-related domain-containing protein n=1 Tax=Diaminobutyricimonas aerilata TaxID=1162967 RepID=A0A2M9CIA5_9MICO|nr:YciI family protein [Diaminobutyricimonas aerilata]PJJ71600.1 hypothetical protein CLV46_1149 [Diaminobutyricimonas aerilata]